MTIKEKIIEETKKNINKERVMGALLPSLFFLYVITNIDIFKLGLPDYHGLDTLGFLCIGVLVYFLLFGFRRKILKCPNCGMPFKLHNELYNANLANYCSHCSYELDNEYSKPKPSSKGVIDDE